jgi:hypothetical protein
VFGGSSSGTALCSTTGRAYLRRCRRIIARCLNSLRKPHRIISVMLPFSIWREAFINDADLDVARASYEQLSPEPYQQMIEPLDLRKFYTLDTPRSYLTGAEGIALPPGEWGGHPRMSRRLGLYRLVQMPGSHEVIFSDPNGLADKIIEAGRD